MKPCVALAALVLLSGCTAPSPPGLEVAVFDEAVSCDASGCWSSTGRASGEEHRVRVRVSTSGRRLRLQGQLRRPGGVLGVLEVEVPLGAAPAAPPRVLYSEVDQRGQVLFSAARAWGRVELSLDEGCPCQTGRLELQLFDPGPDGALDTADDRVRQLSQARLRRDGRPFCHARAALPIRAGLLVVGERACPVGRSSAAPIASGWGAAGCVVAGWNEDGWYDVGWVGEWREGWDDSDAGFSSGWDAEGWDDGGSSDGGWSDGGRSDDGWSDDGWSDDGWSDDGWGDNGGSDSDWGDDGGSDSDWGDDGGSDSDWGDDGGSDSDWGDDDEGWW